MKKAITVVVGLVVLAVLGVYILLFTQLGNNILKPVLQDKLSKASGRRITVETFSLRPSYLKLSCCASGKRFLEVSGKFSLFSRSMNLNYTLDIEDTSKFFRKRGLTGSLKSKGKIIGKFDNFNVVGKARIFSSNVNYLMNFKDKELSSLRLKTQDLDIAKLLRILGMPAYVDGYAILNTKIDNLQENGKGEAELTVNNGLTNPEALKHQFGFENAKIPFKAKFFAKATGRHLNITGKILSEVAKVYLTKGVFDIRSGSFSGNFLLKIPDLNKLYFATKHRMRGALTFNGNFKLRKSLLVNARCKDFAGGLLNVKLKGHNLKADYSSGKLVELLDMFEYPRFFDSTVNAKVKHDIKDKKGKSHIVLLNGHFLPNRMTYLIGTLLGFNMTGEIYQQSTIDSKINNGIIVSNLNMKSKRTTVSSKDAYVNLRTNQINATLNMDISGNKLKVKIKGNINRPSIGVDVKDLLKNKLKIKGKIIEIPKSIIRLF